MIRGSQIGDKFSSFQSDSWATPGFSIPAGLFQRLGRPFGSQTSRRDLDGSRAAPIVPFSKAECLVSIQIRCHRELDLAGQLIEAMQTNNFARLLVCRRLRSLCLGLQQRRPIWPSKAPGACASAPGNQIRGQRQRSELTFELAHSKRKQQQHQHRF